MNKEEQKNEKESRLLDTAFQLFTQKGIKDIEYNITTNFRKNFISIRAKGKIKVEVLENMIRLFKKSIIKINNKRICFR